MEIIYKSPKTQSPKKSIAKTIAYFLIFNLLSILIYAVYVNLNFKTPGGILYKKWIPEEVWNYEFIKFIFLVHFSIALPLYFSLLFNFQRLSRNILAVIVASESLVILVSLFYLGVSFQGCLNKIALGCDSEPFPLGANAAFFSLINFVAVFVTGYFIANLIFLAKKSILKNAISFHFSLKSLVLLLTTLIVFLFLALTQRANLVKTDYDYSNYRSYQSDNGKIKLLYPAPQRNLFFTESYWLEHDTSEHTNIYRREVDIFKVTTSKQYTNFVINMYSDYSNLGRVIGSMFNSSRWHMLGRVSDQLLLERNNTVSFEEDVVNNIAIAVQRIHNTSIEKHKAEISGSEVEGIRYTKLNGDIYYTHTHFVLERKSQLYIIEYAHPKENNSTKIEAENILKSLTFLE